MSDFAQTVREALAALAAADRGLRRFGAAAHRYALYPPVSAPVTAALPDELAEFARTIGGGGAGPGYGLEPLDRIRPAGGAWPVAHLGCGHVAMVSEAGEVVLVAAAAGVVVPLAPSFTAWYLAWIDAVARNALAPDVPAGRCPLAQALSGYLAHAEAAHGGPLDDAATREALAALGPGAIAIAAEEGNPLFDPDDPVEPCLACALLVANLGLPAGVVAPGVAAKPSR